MTAQAPEQLINEHPSVDFGSMNLYGVIRGNVSANHGWGTPYEFLHAPRPLKRARANSALWRGFVASFRLTSKGNLILCGYAYSDADQEEESFEELLHGEFWMVMKHNFFGPRTYIPFHEGRIVESVADWIREPRRSNRVGAPSVPPDVT